MDFFVDFKINSAKCSVYYHVILFIIYILVSLHIFHSFVVC